MTAYAHQAPFIPRRAPPGALKPAPKPAPRVTRETFFSLYWQTAVDRIRMHLCVLAGLDDSVCLLFWDELTPRQRDALRVHLVTLLEGHETNRNKQEGRK